MPPLTEVSHVSTLLPYYPALRLRSVVITVLQQYQVQQIVHMQRSELGEHGHSGCIQIGRGSDLRSGGEHIDVLYLR